MSHKDPIAKAAYHKKYMQEVWYPANKEKHKARVRVNDARRHTDLKAKSDGYKLEKGCQDCGYRDHPEALDFDHVRGEKLFNVGDMVRRHRSSWDKILTEIEKCEVVCANCHRVRTAKRRQN